MNGWICLHRSVMDHWIWQDPVKFRWWVDILLVVNHKDSKVNIGMQIIDCKRGQCVMSLLNWGKRWNVSKHAVHNFFTLLKNDDMITTENLIKTTRITVCNYDSYQDVENAEGTLREQSGNATGTLRDTNNKENNVNNDNKEIKEKPKRFIPPTLSEIKDYCSERKNKVDPEAFVNYYESNGWKVGPNRMKSWKAAVRTWEKNERSDKSYKHPAANYSNQKKMKDERW